MLRFFVRRAGATVAAGSILFYCSCERHHLGELPEEQLGKPAERTTTTAEPKTTTSRPAIPAASATPAEFFPKKANP